MRIVIIEDETPAANRLIKMLQSINPSVEIIGKADSIEASVKLLQTLQPVDLIFMDIQLADGLSFEIFNQTAINCPVIFTTAFDQYTLKAFKVNSIDYLLKPIDTGELTNAIEKFEKLYSNKQNISSAKLLDLLNELNKNRYKERLLIKRGQQISYLKINTLAYCFADGKLCFAVDTNGNKFMLENTLSQLEEQLNPSKFYRINRHLLVNIEAVAKVHSWLGSRLKLELIPTTNIDTIVSREKVNGFKEWLGG